jgi:excisionase family DNA binding protein
MTTYKTLKEAAQILRSNPRSVRRYIKEGKITYVQLGRKFLFREADLLSLPASSKAVVKSSPSK